ncbi:hypothetical protein [Sphingomonas sp. Leaf208]|uniref:hypothetical protein n=1 Tax=Sphingomonas sp. Leaf208 TaxID=1735679 RepID=UPI0009E7F554|nr:hypothetical protein [Sphingomonas sp. Leaf208]
MERDRRLRSKVSGCQIATDVDPKELLRVVDVARFEVQHPGDHILIIVETTDPDFLRTVHCWKAVVDDAQCRRDLSTLEPNTAEVIGRGEAGRGIGPRYTLTVIKLWSTIAAIVLQEIILEIGRIDRRNAYPDIGERITNAQMIGEDRIGNLGIRDCPTLQTKIVEPLEAIGRGQDAVVWQCAGCSRLCRLFGGNRSRGHLSKSHGGR